MDSSHLQPATTPLKIHVIPFIAPGHIIPLSELARIFASRGEHVTIITTPFNADLLQKSIDEDRDSGEHIGIHTVEWSATELGLPHGVENLSNVTDLETGIKLHRALVLMQKQMEDFMTRNPPDCIIADTFYPWASEFANRMGIPRLIFFPGCTFALCLMESIRSPDSPHRRLSSDSDPFVVPGLPHPIILTRSQLPEHDREDIADPAAQFMDQCKEAAMKSYGIILNNFAEIETEYTEHYKKITGHKVWHIGPAAAIVHRNAKEKAEGLFKSDEHDNNLVINWLNSKEPNSVVYVCFGSGCQFPDKQLYEIACGLELSGHQFIWVVRGKDKQIDVNDDEEKTWLPKGFEERMKTENKGLIVRGWAPQVLVLDHPSLGCFLTHCGWNSTIEGITAGVPLITWPVYSEQFYNEKLITQVHGNGVGVGSEEWIMLFSVAKSLVSRDKIENAVRKIMDGGDEALEIRRRARELGEKARKAASIGGSSDNNLTAAIEDLKRLREDRSKLKT
ncbi:Glycosyltransferase [Quillaja saponaria]|uniref:Glycosyltransferase n=1 Tax=Quillaja saponaria TaxID=32244 RepID=A0AAD7LMX4_QUISA|nr:Glycosyltransferase [Quillaja saponaria]WEU75102.1 UGT73CY2 [Quillaja saponaria]